MDESGSIRQLSELQIDMTDEDIEDVDINANKKPPQSQQKSSKQPNQQQQSSTNNNNPHLPPLSREMNNNPHDYSQSTEIVRKQSIDQKSSSLDRTKSISRGSKTNMNFTERIKKQQQIAETMRVLSNKEFGLDCETLNRVCNFDDRNSPELFERLETEFGGVMGVAHALRTDVNTGLQRKRIDKPNEKSTAPSHKISPELETASAEYSMDVSDGEHRQRVFGSNQIPPPPSESILQMIIGQIKEDVILKVLIVGAIGVTSLGTALCPAEGWVDGMGIMIAVLLVLGVTSGNDWDKDRKFKKLLLLQSEKQVKVIRGGVKDQISSWNVVVGDLIELVPGDEIPVDGLFLRGTRLVVDESPLTGESLPVKKNESMPFMFSGCQVSEGSAIMIATAVGSRSCGGQIQKILNEAQSEETALQGKLKVVAVLIGKIGVAAGVLTFLALAVRWAIFW
jgi:Ca2+-transporting ATPase